MSEEEQPKKKKSPREKPVQYWLIRVIAVLTPAFLSYCQAKSEAETEAKAIAKKQAGRVEDVAGAGYDEMVMAVKHLDDELKEYRKELYSMRGHIEAIESRLSMRIRAPRPPISEENPPASGSGAGSAATPSFPAPPEKSPLNLAPNLDQAAAKHGVQQKM